MEWSGVEWSGVDGHMAAGGVSTPYSRPHLTPPLAVLHTVTCALTRERRAAGVTEPSTGRPLAGTDRVKGGHEPGLDEVDEMGLA